MARSARPWRWSISRSHLLQECPRAFEFHLKRGDNSVNQSNLIKLAALTGIASHEAISVELDRWASGGIASEREAIVSAMSFLDEVWESRTERIIEVRNGLELEPVQIETCRRVVQGRLKRFFEMLWPQFSGMRHESHEKLEGFGGCALPVVVKIDLACWNEQQQVVIADWKTGSWQNLVSGRVQLAVYALWARNRFALPLEAILPALVSLQTGEIQRFHPTEYDIQFVRDEIKADSDRTKLFLRKGEFPASPQPEKCRGCAFLPRCEEGSEAVGL